MAKAAFNKKKSFFDCKLELNLRKKLVPCYYTWSIDLYVAELWKLRKIDQKYLASFEVLCWRRTEFSWHKGKGKGTAVPLQAWSGPQCSRKLRFPNFMTTAQDGGKVVSLKHQPPLLPGNTPVVQLEGLYHWKIPMTPSGIEPAACQFVA